MADDAITERGRRLTEVASDIPEEELLEHDAVRQIYNNYDAIMAILSIGEVTSRVTSYDGYPRIKEYQAIWAEGESGAGTSGEILSRIGGLLGVGDILTPSNEEKFKEKLYESTLEAMRSGKLAKFISDKYPAISKKDEKAGDSLRGALKLDEREMTEEGIQQVFKESLSKKS